MRPLRPATTVVLLALGLMLPACGGDREGLLSSGRAERLRDDLDAIDAAVSAGRCDAVDGRLASLRREVEDLPGSVDRGLRRRLREGATNLEEQAPDECREQRPDEPRTQPETTPETTPQETVPEETTPPETTPPETTPPQTTPPQTTPPQTTPPGDGTTPPGQGGTPPGQGDGDEGGAEAPQFGIVAP